MKFIANHATDHEGLGIPTGTGVGFLPRVPGGDIQVGIPTGYPGTRVPRYGAFEVSQTGWEFLPGTRVGARVHIGIKILL